MPLIMLGRPTPNHQRRKQKAKFSMQSTRPEKVYWERRARFSPLLGLPPIPLRLGTCYCKSIPRVQFHHVRKSHYHQKVSGCLQNWGCNILCQIPHSKASKGSQIAVPDVRGGFIRSSKCTPSLKSLCHLL